MGTASTLRRHLAVGCAAFGAVAALGPAAGLLWWLLAPRAEVTVGPEGQVVPYPVSEALFAGEGYFAMISIVAGLACGYTAYLLQYRIAGARRSDLRVAVLLGLAGGSLLGALLAWAVGTQLDAPAFERAMDAAAQGETVEAGLGLRAHGAVLLWPFVAVLQYAVFDAVSIWRGDLGHRRFPVPDFQRSGEGLSPAARPGAAGDAGE